MSTTVSLYAWTDELERAGDQVFIGGCFQLRYLNTLYIRDHRAQVRQRRKSLIVSSPTVTKRIPIEGVDGVVLMGNAQITTQALESCVRRGIRIAALSMGGKVRFVVGGITGGNVHLRTSLYKATIDEAHTLAISKTIVGAKLQSSRRVVGRWARGEKNEFQAKQLVDRAEQIRERIPRLMQAQSGDHVRGIEGDGARIYFRAVAHVMSKTGFSFSKRTRRPPRDPVNSALSFVYSLLVTEYVGATESVGLDYQIGFLHRARSGRPSLALDLVEELRPVADRFVVTLIRRRQLREDSFTRTKGGGVYLSDSGRGILLRAWEQHKEKEIHHQLLGKKVERWALPTIQATLLARHLRGDLPSYPPFVLS